MAAMVNIKSYQGGLRVILDSTADFDCVKSELAAKFKQSARFLGEAQMALAFSGRCLTDNEENELLEIISQNCNIDVCCLIVEDPEKGQEFIKAMRQFAMAKEDAAGQLVKGCVTSGKIIESRTNIIILGDVNPGAVIVASGSIVVLGTIYGAVHAGHHFENPEEDILDGEMHEENPSNFVAALELRPTRISVDGVEAYENDKAFRAPILTRSSARIAYRDGTQIKVDNISKEFLNKIPF